MNPPTTRFGFTLFPNPSQNGSVQLVMDAPVNRSGTVSIHDASGKLVAQQRLNGSASTAPQTINVGVQPGLYLVRMSGEGLNATSRLVIQ